MKKKWMDLGLLLVRVGVGASMIINHGYEKMISGPQKWEAVGKVMEELGITFLPLAWGFMAAFAEFFGALFLMTGFLTRGAAFLLSFLMFVAFYHHLHAGDGFKGASHPFELMCIFILILFIGGGKYSLDSKIKISKWLQ